MSAKKSLSEFQKHHPWPDKNGIATLFRFYKYDRVPVEHLKHLFIEKKLHHSLPSQFNDPFECKPHFNWPKAPDKVRAIRQHLIKLAKKDGLTQNSAESLVSKNMGKHEYIKKVIFDAIQKNFGKLRICSFTTDKENLLFWAHYADSHKGFCVEFDATKMPIAYAYKVHYQDEYPEVVYPRPSDATAFSPALIKSKIWGYEEEYRTVFIPKAVRQPENDGESLILSGNEIKNIYLGLNMKDEDKEQLLEVICSGPFRPRIWDAHMSKSEFKLGFSERC